MKDWIMKTFLVGWLKEKLLDKLPLSGFKRLIGVLLLVLSILMQAMPQYVPMLQFVADILNSLNPEIIQDAGVISLVTGTIHWLLKKYAPAIKAR